MARVIQASDDFATDGERRAAEELAKLPEHWTVIANKVLPTPRGDSREIDFIVIADRHVFAIDEKSWRGRIHGSDAIWVRDDGSSERSPLNKIDMVAKILAGHLRARVPRFDALTGYPVTGCVLLSKATERPILNDSRAPAQVLLLPSVVEALQRLDRADGDPGAGPLRKGIERALEDLTHRPKFPRAIGDYAITEVVSGHAGSYVCHARHADGDARSLTVYNVASRDRDEQEFYLREFRALKDLRDTGAVPACQDWFSWSDDFLVVPSDLPAGISVSALPLAANQDEARRELARAAAAFRALARIHDASVTHRALGPEHVFIAEDGGAPRIMLTGFFAARRGDRTISPRLDALQLDDPYAAPEIAVAGYGVATPESDTYSLALVWLERLAGVPVARLRGEDGTARVPDAGDAWSYFPQEVAADAIPLFRAALTPGPLAKAGSASAKRLTAAECADRLDVIVQRWRTDTAVVQGDKLDGRYRVERVLGAGATARTFLASDEEADGLFALKQFLRPAAIADTRAARREFDLLRNFPHRNLPRVYDVYPASNDVHVKLEYVEGAKLADILPHYLGRLDRCRALAADLLAAVEHLERHHLLHRDVKPDNVIVRDSGEAVLIDFGAAAPAGTQLDPAGTPGYLPPEAYAAAEPPPTSDRYALGVLLFHALTGRVPFAAEGNVFAQQPLDDVEFLPEAQRAFARALLRAVAAEPDERFPSAAAFRAALLHQPEPDESASDATLPEEINPWVNQLRGLFRNSARGNADNRGLDSDFARATYVPTALDERLLPAILDQRPRAVFLSGNPGDGKTAFLERVRDALRERGAEPVAEDESGWVWRLGDRTFRACYDASEAHRGQSADEQLAARLDGLQGGVPPRANLTVLVAINDGRLADFLERFQDEFGWLAAEVERAADPAHALQPGGAWLVDLKRRAYVGLRPEAASRSVMRRVLASFVAPERWAICDGCAARAVCPIRRNATALAGEDAAARLEHLLLLSHLRGQRHVTMRDLRSGLAYLVTGDLGCADVHAARQRGEPAPAADYWRAAFTTESDRDLMLGEFALLDPARQAQPRLERLLFFHQAPEDAPLRAALFVGGHDLPPADDALAWLSAVKRRLYFEASPNAGPPASDWRALLPYRHGNLFTAAIAGDLDPASLLPHIARGIGRSDGLSGGIVHGALCLRVAHSDANRLTVLKQFPLAEFALAVHRTPAGALAEAVPQALILSHRPTNARLAITLDLFELLLRFADGLEPGSPELQPLLEDLAPFKNAVQLSNTRDLVLIESGHRRHRLTQRDGKVVRLPFEQEAVSS